MLSAANMFLLGVIEAKPVNPYEIVSQFEYNRFKDILNISSSTVYANIRAMNRKRYIEFVLKDSESAPSKKVYSITDSGRKELKDTIRNYLENYTADMNGFSVALLLMHHFSKEELLGFFENHRNQILDFERARREEHEFVYKTNDTVPCIPNVLCSLEVLFQIKAEREVIDTAMRMLEKADTWPQNTFMVEKEYNRIYKLTHS